MKIRTLQRYKLKKWTFANDRPASVSMIAAEEYEKQPAGTDIGEFRKAFIEKFQNKIINNENPNVMFNLPFDTIQVSGQGPFISNVKNISLVPKLGVFCELDNIGIQFISLRGEGETGYVRISLRNCNVSALFIFTNATEIHIVDCLIGYIDINQNSEIQSLKLVRSYVERIEFPSFKRVLTGDVSLEDTFFERKRSSFLRILGKASNRSFFKCSAQTYRNIRRNLLDLDNVRAASVVNATEMSIARKQYRKGMGWAISYCYELFADYGNSISRPIAWFVGILVLGFLEILKIGFIIPTAKSQGDIVHGTLGQSTSRVINAIVLELHYLRDPFFFLSERRHIAALNIYFSFLLSIENITALVMLGLSIVAMRRQYKLGR